MNTKINYLYRDADNYKVHNVCVVEGTLTKQQIKGIIDCCNDGEYFIPRQIGLPEKRFDSYDPAVDHCWFEIDESCFEQTASPSNIAMTAQQLMEQFAVCKNNWDDRELKMKPMEGMQL